jgi:hypothetical protein
MFRELTEKYSAAQSQTRKKMQTHTQRRTEGREKKKDFDETCVGAKAKQKACR